MKIRVAKASSVDWDDFVVSSEESTVFHTRHWLQLFSDSFPISTEARLFLVDGEAKALMPYAVHSQGRKAPILSGPLEAYGGPILKSFKSKEETEAIADHFSKSFKRFRLRQNPFSAIKLNEHIAHFENTQLVYLQETLRNTFQRFAPEWEDLVFKAKQKHQVQVTEDPADWRAVFEISHRSSHAAKEALPLSVVRGIHHWPTERRRLYVATKNDKDEIQAALLCLNHKKTCTAWRLVYRTQDSLGYDQAACLLHTVAIEGAFEQGVSVYDLMPSGESFDQLRVKNYFRPSTLPSPLLVKGIAHAKS